MKRKYVAVTLGILMGLSVLGGCESSSTSDKSETETTSQVYGEITQVGEDSITIEIGTKREMDEKEDADSTDRPSSGADGETSSTEDEGTTQGQQGDTEEQEDGSGQESAEEDSSQGQQDNPQNQGEEQPPQMPEGETPSMLELTGEEQEITVTDETEFTRQSMGQGPGGGKPEGEQPPEKPSGQEEQTEEGSSSGSATTQEDGESSDELSKPEESSGTPAGEGEESSEDGGSGQGQEMEQSEEEIGLEDLAEGDTVSVTLNGDGSASEITVMSMGQGAGGGQEEAPESYQAVKEYTSDTDSVQESVESTGTDESAVHVTEGAQVTFDDLTVSRNSKESKGGDTSSFYGVGAAVLTTEGTSYIKNSSIETDAAGGAGIFSYGEGTTYVADTSIDTAQDTSGGIHVAGGGTLYAWDLRVETDGESSAAIRSDRGGGTMVVDGGTYTSNGTGSPAIYCTADIAVNNAKLTANGSEAVCIEGLNSLHLYDADLTGSMGDDEQNDCTWNVILYQSMSGDSQVGNSTFEMVGGSLTAENGGMFYTTNTESTITLSNVNLTYADDSEFFLRCTGNGNQRGWGTSGENGADCLFTAIDQQMEGDVVWDSISKLDFYMDEGSSLRGAIVDDETYAGEGGQGYCNLYLAEGSVWTVTGDSTLSALSSQGTIVDETGKTVTVKGSDGTVYVEGDSSYTVTVDSYGDSVDLSGESEATQWDAWQVEKPSQLA